MEVGCFETEFLLLRVHADDIRPKSFKLVLSDSPRYIPLFFSRYHLLFHDSAWSNSVRLFNQPGRHNAVPPAQEFLIGRRSLAKRIIVVDQ